MFYYRNCRPSSHSLKKCIVFGENNKLAKIFTNVEKSSMFNTAIRVLNYAQGVIPMESKHIAKKKVAVLAVAGILLAAITGGLAWFLYWKSLPPQQFACWPPVTVQEDRVRTLAKEESKPVSSSDPFSTISLTVDEVKRNKDGSGFLTYTLTNTADPNDPAYREESGYYGGEGPWLDYRYHGQYYQIYPRTDHLTLYAPSVNSLVPGETYTDTILFDEKTLAATGTYRFEVKYVGEVSFLLMDDGEVVF